MSMEAYPWETRGEAELRKAERLLSRSRVLFARRRRWAARILADEGSVRSAEALARALAGGLGGRAGRIAREALSRLDEWPMIDVVCRVWADTRNPILGDMVAAGGWVASEPPAVRLLTALRAGRPVQVGAEMVPTLIEAATGADQVMAERAREAAAGLEPVPGALYLFLTGQWAAYDALDFDQSLLRAVYDAAGPQLRRAMAARAQDGGRREWVALVAGGRRLRLAQMSAAEWQAAVSVLEGSADLEQLWTLAVQAPPQWGARILRSLAERGWEPAVEAEIPGYRDLIRLARAYPDRHPVRAAITPGPVLAGAVHGVSCLAVTPDGSLLAAGEPVHGTVRLWRLPGGAPHAVLTGHGDGIACLAITPDGGLLASGSYADPTVRLWRLPGGTPHAVLGHRVPESQGPGVGSMAVTPDGELLATESGGTISLWRLRDGACHATLEGDGLPIRGLLVTPDGGLLAGASLDGTVRLWRLPDGAPHSVLGGHEPGIACPAVTPDGGLLATGSPDGVRLWQLPDGVPHATLPVGSGRVGCLAVTPDGGLLAGGGGDGTVRLWRLPDGAPHAVLEGHADAVVCLAVTPDGSLLASGNSEYPGGAGDNVRLWQNDYWQLWDKPTREIRLDDVERALACALSDQTRARLEFSAALVRWRRRFDVEIAAKPPVVPAGEFDIELGG